MNSIKQKYLLNPYFHSDIFHGQGIVAAPKAYFAKQSMERVRRGTAESPVFCVAKNGPKNQIKEIEKLLACITCRKWKMIQLNKYDINIT